MFRTLSRIVLLGISVGPLLLQGEAAHATTTYDMVKDFSIKENPNGVWAYWDYIDNTPLAYSRRSYKGVKGFECWTNDQLRPDRLTIGINKTGQTLTLDNGNFVLPPGYVMIDPEHDADAYVLFTAPVSGRYTINGRFIPLARKEAHQNYAYIFKVGGSNQEIWHAKIDGHGPKRFSLSISLDQGNSLQFIQRRDTGKQPNYVGVTARITGP